VYVELSASRFIFSDRLYYDKTNAMLWIDRNDRTISRGDKQLYKKGEKTLADFDRLHKITSLTEAVVDEDKVK